MIIEDMFGNKIEFGTAIADRAISITINEPKFGNEVLVRMNPKQAREFAEHIVAAASELED